MCELPLGCVPLRFKQVHHRVRARAEPTKHVNIDGKSQYFCKMHELAFFRFSLGKASFIIFLRVRTIIMSECTSFHSAVVRISHADRHFSA